MKKITPYTITDIAKELGVTRQTIYYWIKHSWVMPKRDYRNYPVFTHEDLRRIKKWQQTMKKGVISIKQRHKRKLPADAAPIATPRTHSTPLPSTDSGRFFEGHRAMSKCGVNPEQAPAFRPGNVEGLTWEEIQKTLYKS